MRLDAASGGTDEDDVFGWVLIQELDQGGVVDAAVEAAEDEGVDSAEGSEGGDGGLGDGGDAVVVPGDAAEEADALHAVAEGGESGKWRAESGKWLAQNERGHATSHESIAAVMLALQGCGIEQVALIIRDSVDGIWMHFTFYFPLSTFH